MAKDYTIFFENKRVIISENIEQHFINDFGLFVSYASPLDLSKILDFFQSVKEVDNVFITGKKVDKILGDVSSQFTLIEAAGGMVVNKKGEYLLIFRRGKWDLPKGKMDDHEKIENTALREVSEETGASNLKLEKFITETYHIYKIEDMTILKKTSWYEMYSNGDEILVPQLNEDILEARWVRKDQLDQVLANTYDTIIEVFRTAGVI